MNVMMIPAPQSLMREIRETVPTAEEVQLARIALTHTNGNAPRACGQLRQTMSLAKSVMAIQVAVKG